jgi:hypothetical protein
MASMTSSAHPTAAAGDPSTLRRSLLVSIALMAVMPWRWATAASPKTAPVIVGDDVVRLRRALAEIFGDLDALRTVGHRYLARHPEDGDRQHLITALVDPAWSGEPGDLRRHLADQRQREFSGDDIVIVDGWVMARSEGRIGALAVLLAENSHVS